MTEEQVVSYEPTDTKKLQLKSLDAFAACLGYHRGAYLFQTEQNYFSADRCNKHISNLSFDTMCRLHNHGLLAWRYSGDEAKISFDKYRCVTANAAKIVQVVKLQLDKKLKRIICQNNCVKFVHLEYEALFLEE